MCKSSKAFSLLPYFSCADDSSHGVLSLGFSHTVGKPEVSRTTPWKGVMLCCLTNTLFYEVSCSVFCIWCVLAPSWMQVTCCAAFADPMVGGNAMIERVCCHWHGGHVVLRRSNMGCAVYCWGGTMENSIQPPQGTWAPIWGPCTGKGGWL